MKFRKTFAAMLILFASLCGCGRIEKKRVDVDLQREFAKAAWNGNIPWMKSFIARGADVNVAGEGYGLPIINAATSGHTEAVRFLLDRGADVNAKHKWEQTALMGAAANGHFETANLLLLRGADVNAVGEGYTALRWAEEKGHTKVAKLLREAGAKEKALSLR